jgi:hypothetical protein
MPAAISPIVARRATLVGDVLARQHDAGRNVVGVAQRDAAPGDEAILAVGAAHVILAALRFIAAAHEQRAERVARMAAILRRDAAVDPEVADYVGVRALEHAHGALVDEPHDAGPIRRDQHHLGEVEIQAIELALLLERRERLATQRCVVQVTDELRWLGIRDAADREEHGKLAAIAVTNAHVTALADDARLAAREVALEVLVVVQPVHRGHEHAHVAAEGVAAAVAEHLFGGGVEGQDPAAIVHDHDRIERSLQHGEDVG